MHFTQLNTEAGDAFVDAGLAELVDLKFFCRFSLAEIAAQRAVSERTIQRDWDKARLALFADLKDDDAD